MKVLLGFILFFSCLSITAESWAKSKKDSASYVKKMKASKKKNAQILKKIAAESKKQSLRLKMQEQEEIKKAQFNAKLAKRARNQIANMAREWQKAKTVGDWIEKSKKKFKVKRRLYFSKYMKLKVPEILHSDYSVALNFSEKKDMILTLYPSFAGLRLFINGVDVTPKKGENFKKWVKRKDQIMGKKTAFNWSDLFFSKAWATIDFDESVFSNAFSFSAWQDWENQTFNPSSETPNAQRFAELLRYGQSMRRNMGLSCNENGWGFFTVAVGGVAQPIRTNPPNSRGSMITMDFLSEYGRGEALATLEVSKSNHLTNVSSRRGQVVRAFDPRATIPVLQAAVHHQPFPEFNYEGTHQIPHQAPEVTSAFHNVQACTAAERAGADTSMCRSDMSPQDYGQCLTENILQGDLRVERSLLGGAWNSTFGSDPVGGVHEMGPAAALALKGDLLRIYRDQTFTVRRPGRFPDVGGSIGFGITELNGERALAALSHGETGGEFQAQAVACYQALINREPCEANLLPEGLIQNLTRSAEAHLAIAQPGPTLPELSQQMPSVLENASASCRALLPEEMQHSLQDLATYHDIAEKNAGPDEVNFNRDLQRAFLYSDIAHACCGNAQCRGEIMGNPSGFSDVQDLPQQRAHQ